MNFCLFVKVFTSSDMLAKDGEFLSMFRRSNFGRNRQHNYGKKERKEEISIEVFPLAMTCTVPELIYCWGLIIAIVFSAVQKNTKAKT